MSSPQQSLVGQDCLLWMRAIEYETGASQCAALAGAPKTASMHSSASMVTTADVSTNTDDSLPLPPVEASVPEECALSPVLSVVPSATAHARPQPPHLLVFSGGTAFNTIAGYMRRTFPKGVLSAAFVFPPDVSIECAEPTLTHTHLQSPAGCRTER
jgi:hypothetical protein